MKIRYIQFQRFEKSYRPLSQLDDDYTKPFKSRLLDAQSPNRKTSKCKAGRIFNPPKGATGFHAPN